MRIHVKTLPILLFILSFLFATEGGTAPPAKGATTPTAQEFYDLVVAKCKDERYSLSFYKRGERLDFGSFPGDFYRDAGQEEASDSIFTGTWEKSSASRKSLPSVVRTAKLCFYGDNCFIFVEIESMLVREEDSPPYYRDSKLQERYGTWNKTKKNRARIVFSPR